MASEATDTRRDDDDNSQIPRKRARFDRSQWETVIQETNLNSRIPACTLQELFDGRRWNPSKKKLTSCSHQKVTFRLEHRNGGPLAAHPGEERILLFRSDQKGAIAKIIFSCTEEDGAPMAYAKIHVLDVKSEYRGFDLGGLLFTEALASLQSRGQTVHCELDAEEDIRRHNKLVGFYSRMGCIVKPNTKPQFLNNNDGETYRKVPMQIDLQAKAESTSSLGERCFVPILILGSHGRKGRLASDDGKVYYQQNWLLAEDGQGYVQFRTTHGSYLTIDGEGLCLEEVDASSGRKCTFQLLRISDKEEKGCDEATDNVLSENDLWIILSPYGTFLNLNPASFNLEGTKNPAFWHVNSSDHSLTCTTDTPIRRQYYRESWIYQTFDYVHNCKKKYGGFKLARMTLREALDRAKMCRGFPLRMDADNLSLRSLCYRTAEVARAAGHPDWVQLVALLHSLGGIVRCIESTAVLDDFDWTIPSTSRVVGCASPATTTFAAEFKDLNADEHDPFYNSLHGHYSPHCGLANVELTWSGPEYMHMMLNHNAVDLPQEGFDLLRLCCLSDWHSNHQYESLSNENDQEIQSFVADFDQLREQAAKQLCLGSIELTDVECDRLWQSHYASIAAKFGCDGVLEW